MVMSLHGIAGEVATDVAVKLIRRSLRELSEAQRHFTDGGHTEDAERTDTAIAELNAVLLRISTDHKYD